MPGPDRPEHDTDTHITTAIATAAARDARILALTDEPREGNARSTRGTLGVTFGDVGRGTPRDRRLTPLYPYPVNVFRLSSRADPAFLAEMLYEAVNWRDDGAEERPPFDELLAKPEHRRYVDDWGRKGDVAIVALDRLEEPVGAAWYRLFSADAPGYGFVAADIPELSIGVYPECRGQRVGSLLLGTLVSQARTDGYRAISLSVAAANPARRLYERYGFEPAEAPTGEPVRDADASLTLVLDLT